MKDLVRSRGFTTPDYTLTDGALDLIRFADTHPLPFVVKPRNATGSMSTTVLKTKEEVEEFLSKNYNPFYRSNFMVETFVMGRVFQVDGIYDGQDVIFSWPSVYLNSCLEMAVDRKVLGSHLLSPANPMVTRLIQYSNDLLKIFPTTTLMPFHLEVFVSDQNEEIIFCEIASRVGGYVSKNWELGLGINLEEMFLKMQAGTLETMPNFAPPESVCGWLLFPAQASKIIAEIPEICPFMWCRSYKPLVKKDDHINCTLGICTNLALAYLSAENEREFSEKSLELIEWFTSLVRYKE